jgi:hypothetical protein
MKNCFSPSREPQQNLPPVFAAARSFQKTMYFETIHELHGAMVLNLKPLCQEPDGGVARRWQSLDGQKRLILLRLNSGRTRSLFA